jgi:hypothetical protein
MEKLAESSLLELVFLIQQSEIAEIEFLKAQDLR